MSLKSYALALCAGLTLAPGLACAGDLLICVTSPVPFHVHQSPGPMGAFVPGAFMSSRWLTGPFAHEANHAQYHCSDGQVAHLSGLLMGGGYHLISVEPSMLPVHAKIEKKASVPKVKGAHLARPVRMAWRVVATLVTGG